MNIKSKEVSVIVPVYNDLSGLKDTLNSLVKQNFSKDLFEIIVVDNGSTDGTLSVIERFIDRYPKLIRMVLEKDIQSSYAARNKAIEKAKGLIIAFIDADMTVEKDWLKEVIESLRKNHTDCLVCNLEVIHEGHSIFALYDKIVAFPMEKYVKKSHFTPVGCLTIYKDIFNKMGFFDSNLISGGDREFGNRIYSVGYKIYYEPNIVMKHPVRHSPKQIFAKAFRIGRGYKQMSFYYPERYEMRIRNIFNPRYFSPIKSILRFARSMRENEIWEKLTCLEKLLICLIHWGYLLTNHFGYIYESLFGLRRKKKT